MNFVVNDFHLANLMATTLRTFSRTALPPRQLWLRPKRTPSSEEHYSDSTKAPTSQSKLDSFATFGVIRGRTSSPRSDGTAQHVW